MTQQEFAARIEALVMAGREASLPDEAMAAALQDAADALEEGLS